MTDPTDKFSQDLQTISLTTEERQSMRAKLYAMTQLQRPRAGSWAFLVRHAAAFSTLAIFATTGTALATAQRAMPGDTLYPLRLAVNDRVAVVVAGNEDARLDLELQHAERMMDEEEIVLNSELAALITADEPASADDRDPERSVQLAPDTTVQVDVELEAELRALEDLLQDEESAAEIELSL